MNKCLHTELSSHEGTRSEFNPGKTVIKLGIDVHQEMYVVVCQEEGSNPKPAQRFKKEAFLYWVAKLKQKSGAGIHAVYEACGFGFGLQRQLAALGIATLNIGEYDHTLHRFDGTIPTLFWLGSLRLLAKAFGVERSPRRSPSSLQGECLDDFVSPGLPVRPAAEADFGISGCVAASRI
jgi:hypothetical protein